jgi:hypothetical protein
MRSIRLSGNPNPDHEVCRQSGHRRPQRQQILPVCVEASWHGPPTARPASFTAPADTPNGFLDRGVAIPTAPMASGLAPRFHIELRADRPMNFTAWPETSCCFAGKMAWLRQVG